MPPRKRTKSWGDIAFDDDIILNVAEKTGFSEKQVQVVFHFIFFFIKKDIKNPDRHTLRLPHLGLLYIKVEYARHKIERIKKREENGGTITRATKDRMERLQYQIDLFDEYYKKYTPEKSKFSVHKYRSTISAYAFTKGMSKAEIEELQNHRHEQENY